MDDNMKKRIKNTIDDVEIPNSLSPEEIEKKLDEWENTVDEEGKKKWKGGRYLKKGMVAAASIAIVLSVGFSLRSIRLYNDDTVASLQNGAEGEQTDTGYRIPGVMHSAQNYDEVEKLIASARKKSFGISAENGYWMEESVEESAESSADSTGKSADATGSMDYSDTNVRTEGVNEGDIVKTDGNYIYQLVSSEKVRIVKIFDGQMEEESVVQTDDIGDGVINEFYVDGNRLYLIAEMYSSETLLENNGTDDVWYYSSSDEDVQLNVLTYDISDRTNPKLTGNVKIDGTYYTSRMKDGYLYVMSQYGESLYYVCGNMKSEGKGVEDVVPKINDQRIAAGDILIPEEEKDEPFFVTTAIDVSNPSEVSDVKAVMGYVRDVYVSSNAIYFYDEDYSGNVERTTLVKFSYEDGLIVPEAAGSVKGRIDDSFSIDEDSNGNLRVMTTLWKESGELESSLYILDEKMKRVGSLLNISGNEGVKSCRFMGDRAYVVTFRNTDPLFTIDLSDAKNPKILSELKLPGFSEYLHPWGDGMLLGIGYDADENSGSVEKVKLSMFDISDPYDTKEITTKILDADGSGITDGNYKSIMISPSEKIFGFYTYSYGDENNDWAYTEAYRVFEFDGEEFQEVFTTGDDQLAEAYESQNVRGVFVGKYFYLVKNKEIISYDRENNYSEVARCMPGKG